MQKNTLKSFMLAAVFAATLIVPPLKVNATLLIMPIHLILGDRDRTGNVTVFNTSGEEAVFRMGWRYQKQLETGAYEVSEEPFDIEHDLSKFAIFSPRQVTLQPGQKQRIRISVRRPPDLPAGEYRAHLALIRSGDNRKLAPEPVTEVPGQPAPESLKPGAPKTESRLTVGLKMNVSYSLPVVVRQGTYDTTASIVNATLLPPDPAAVARATDPKDPATNPQLKVDLSREGKYSVFGKVLVFWTAPGQAEKQIGITNNVNIFPEITKRTVNVRLTEKSIQGGTLRVVYQGEVREKGMTMDEKTFPVGG